MYGILCFWISEFLSRFCIINQDTGFMQHPKWGKWHNCKIHSHLPGFDPRMNSRCRHYSLTSASATADIRAVTFFTWYHRLIIFGKLHALNILSIRPVFFKKDRLLLNRECIHSEIKQVFPTLYLSYTQQTWIHLSEKLLLGLSVFSTNQHF